MCGIIGYIGNKEAVPILLDGLKKLEYRGYDSSGVGVITEKKKRLQIYKVQGKIRVLESLLDAKPLPSSHIGISHTRWATHGKPSKRNAHPHSDASGQFAVVHNGIIENYEELKKELKRKGCRFASETDTEVIVQLISTFYKGNFLEAVIRTTNKLQGAFALAILSKAHPDELIAVRTGSPLIVGVGNRENFIASDVPAILDKTKRVIYLQDQQIAVIRQNHVQVYDFHGKATKPKIDTVHFKIGSTQKEGFPHFMLKEIYEQPKVLMHMLNHRLRKDVVTLDGIALTKKQLKGVKRLSIVACGTAYHAGMVGKYLIERIARLPVSVDVSSEFRYRSPILDKNTLVISVSQSGETADTLAAVREAKQKGAKTISICNVVGSSLARESDGVLYTHAGPEIGVASTKAYTAQLMMFYLLALYFGDLHQGLSKKERQQFLSHLRKIPVLMEKILGQKIHIARIARVNAHFGCFLYLGRNINYPSALEGALKLKEISYIPAEGYAAGEMKHGPIALIDEYRAVVCLAPQSEIYEKMISNMQEIRARRGKIIAIATEGNRAIQQHANNVIYIPLTHRILTPLLVALPLQLIAYYIAVKRGCDVDQPRNLAKSVTVE